MAWNLINEPVCRDCAPGGCARLGGHTRPAGLAGLTRSVAGWRTGPECQRPVVWRAQQAQAALQSWESRAPRLPAALDPRSLRSTWQALSPTGWARWRPTSSLWTPTTY